MLCPSQFDYYNSMLINTVDENGNSVELGGEFPLEENEHFNNLPVNTQQSNIQVPTNVYNKGKRALQKQTSTGSFFHKEIKIGISLLFEKILTSSMQSTTLRL